MSSSTPFSLSAVFVTRIKIYAWRAALFLLVAVLGTVGILGATGVASAALLYAPTITATKTDSFVGGDGDGKADPGETIRYTVAVNNSSSDATGVAYTDTIDSNTTLVGGSVSASPVGVDDTFPVTVVGNVSIDSAALASPFSVTTNDYLGQNPAATIVQVQGITTISSNTITAITTNGGNVVMTVSGANMGKFTYDPPAGFEGTDAFTYILADNTNAASAASNRTATVSIPVSGMVWFVDNNSACSSGCNGRLSHPFTTLAAFNAVNDGAASHPADNDNIFVYESATTYSGGVTLRARQKLIGQDATASLSSITGLTPPTGSAPFPTMNTGAPAAAIDNPSGTAVSNATDVVPAVIRGLTLSGSVNAINLAYSTVVPTDPTRTVQIKDNTIAGSGAQGIKISKDGNFTLTADVSNNTWSAASTGNGFDARTAALAGDFLHLNFSNNTNVNSAATGVFIDGSAAASTITVTGFADNTVSGNTVGNGINVNTAVFDSDVVTAGFQQVSGGATAIGASGNSVGASGMMLTSVSGDLSFTDLDIFANNGTGLFASGTTPYTGSAGFQLAVGAGVATVAAVGGPAVNLSTVKANNLPFVTISSTNSATTGVSLDTVIGAFSAGSGSTITNATGTDFNINAGSAAVTYDGTITDNTGRLVSVSSATGGTKSFTGAISGSGAGSTGISLTNNTGATINFSGGLALSTAANDAFTATGGGTVSATQNNTSIVNTLTTTTGTALNVANTTIGASDLTFRSISANGGANGIVINTTGSSGGLVVTGDVGSANNSSGGTLQNITTSAIQLTSTQDVLLDQMNIQTITRSGINGTGVTNFSFTNGTINNAGSQNSDANIAFNTTNFAGAQTQTGNNISGTLTITGSTLTNGFAAGLDVQSDAGTVTNANISNNTWTIPTATRGAISFAGTGNAGTSFSLNNATINQNNITNTGAAGIQVSISNADPAGPGATEGIPGDPSNIISITNNSILLAPGGTQAIIMSNLGANSGSRTRTNFLIQCNGKNTGGCTAPTGTALGSSSQGTVILVGNNGYSTMTGIVNNNAIVATHTPLLGGGNGIGGGDGVGGAGAAWTPDLTLEVTNNTISGTDGNGILLVNRATNGVANMKIVNNNVGAPVNAGGTARQGIRVDSGNATAGEDTNVCLNIHGNTSLGSNGANGIGIRKNGVVATTDDFGLSANGTPLSPSPATSVQAAAFVAANNTGGADGISGNNFVSCATAPVGMAPSLNHAVAQAQPETSAVALVQPASPVAVNALASVSTPAKSFSKQAASVKSAPVLLTGNTDNGGVDHLVSAVQPAPAQFGETVTVPPVGGFTLPAGKSVTITFDVTVNDPLPQNATRIQNQGTISGGNFSDVLTTNGGPPDCEVGSETCTPIDLVDLTAAKTNDTSGSLVLGNSFNWAVKASNIATSRDAIFTNGQTVLVDHLPAGPTYGVVSPTYDPAVSGTMSCSISSNILTCTVNTSSLTIPSGKFVKATWLVTPNAGGSLVNPTGGVCMVDPTPLFAEVSTANNSCSDTVTVTRPNTTVTSINRQTPSGANTNASSVTWRVTFANAVSGLTSINFTLTDVTSSITGESISSVTAVTGSPDTQWDVTASTGTSGDGTLRLDLANDTSLSHNVTNAPYTGGETYSIDKTAPTATNFNRFNPATTPTNADTLIWQVIFSEDVSGVDADGSDFTVPALTGETISVSSVNASTYNVTVSGGNLPNFNGLVDLDFVSSPTITDLAGNALGSTVVGFDQHYVMDNTAPTVINVTSTAADGSYTTGAVIPVTVQFSEPVTVTGTPQLTLETGATDEVVNYTGGSTTDTLTFNYTVVAGDTSADLDYVATTSLALNGGAIVDAATNNATLTLPTVGGANSIAGQKAIVIDTTRPTVTNVTSTAADGAYTTGASIPVTVTFSEPVTVTGTPQLTLETGATDEVVNYSSGSGTATLTFNYTVSAGDTSADLDYVATTSLALNGGTIRDAATNNAVLTLPTVGGANSIAGQKAIVIDTTAPTVTNVTSGVADATYGLGAIIPVTVTFTEPVTVTGTPQLTLAMTGAPTTEVVDYTGGSGTNTLTFTYTTQLGDASPNLDYVATTSLALNGGTIADAATNNATLTLASPGAAGSLGFNKDIVINATNPVVTNVTSTKPDGSYKAGTVIDVTVTFSKSVTVTGTPQLTLETGATDETVDYASGSGGATLTFSYTVQAGDTSADLDYVGTTSLALNGGTIRDASLNDAILTLASPGAAGSLGFNKAIVIDTTAPTVTNVTSTAVNGTYTTGASIPVTVTFSEPVTVTGTPQLTLETGATDEVVNYTSGTGTSTLTFNYTVSAGDTSSDLDYVAATSLSLNGGTIADAATNNATLTLASPGAAGSLGFNKAIVIDTTAPTVTNVTSTAANGSYTTGASIPVTVTFSEAVTVTGTPQLTLETGATDEVVNYTSGSGSATLTFNYTVSAGDTSADLDYVATNSLALNGGTIQDAATNAATLTLPAVGGANSISGQKAIVIDTTAPTVTNVTSTAANATYGVGAVIPVTVTFTEPVIVTGTPQLTLETGATDEVVNYTSGSGSATLTFNYTVQAGDTSADLDYVAATSLALNGGTIADPATNNAVLTLAAPAAAGSLGFNKAIVIDGVAPTVTNVTSTSSDGTYGIGAVIPVTVTFSETVTVTGAPQLTLETGAIDEVVNYTSGTGTSTLTFNYTVVSGDVSADLDYVATTSLALNGGAIKDATLNDAILTLASPGAAGSLGNNKAIVIDGVRPTVSMNSVALNPTNGSPIPVTVLFSETVTGFTLSDITPGNATVGNFAGSGTSYSFDLTPSGQGAVTADIAANKAVDTANNGNTAATQFSRTYDSVAPTAVLSTLVSSPTNTSPILVTITFNEPVSGVGAGDLSATNGATTIPTGGPTVYTFNLTPTVDGPVTVKYLAGSASDLAGNPNTSDSNTLSITYDTTAPTVTVEDATPGQPTSVSPVHFTATFSESVGSSFDGSDVTLSGTANPTTAVVTGGPAVYDIAVSGMNAAGTVVASIQASKATDLAGNPNAASTSVDNSVDYIYAAPPVITESDPVAVSMSEDGNPIPFALTLHATDANSDPLTWSIFSQGAHGTASAAPGPANSSAISYTPLPNYNGADSFVVQVSDGALTDTITVNVTIQPVTYHGELLYNQSYAIQYDTWFGVQDINALSPVDNSTSINDLASIMGKDLASILGLFPSGYRKATSGTFTFKPNVRGFSRFTWITYRGPDQGKAQVLVDGAVKATVDLYRAVAQWQYPIVISGLTDARHTVVVKPMNAKNPASSGKWVVVDGFKVGSTTYDDDTINLSYSGLFSYGSWIGMVQRPGPRFGAYRISSVANATASASFYGKQVTFVTARGHAYGRVQIWVDGSLKKTVDLYNASQQWQYKVTVTGLTYGPHNVVIKVLGTKSSHSTGTGVVCDGFEIE